MNGLAKPFRKKNLSNNSRRPIQKIKVKLPHVNKKPLARKRNFVQTPLSHYTLKLDFTPKRFHATKLLAFSLHFLFRRDQNPYSNLT